MRIVRTCLAVERVLINPGDVAEVLGPTLTRESVLPGAERQMNGSLLVLEASTIEEVERIVKSDVFYDNNVVSPLASIFCLDIPLS